MKLKSIPVTQVADEYALLLPDTKSSKTHLLVLNPTSLFLWQQLQGVDFNEEDAVVLLLDNYEVSEQSATSDVRRWIAYLKERNLIEE